MRVPESPALEISMGSVAQRSMGRLLLALLVLGLGGCSVLHPPGGLPLGTSIDQARVDLSYRTGQYPLPDGGTRMEFAQGGWGKQTYMLDFDAAGQLVANRQVLTRAMFDTIKPGMTEVDVLSRIGRPVGVFPVGYQQLQVWNWRFAGLEGDCVLFQVSFANATRLVTETGQGYDSACDFSGRD